MRPHESVLLAALCAASLIMNAVGYDIGVALYSFRNVTAFEAIENTQACGGDVVEFFLWQKLSPAHPDVILDHRLSDEHLNALKAKLQAVGVKAVNAYFSNAIFQDKANVEADVRSLFEFARKLGLRGLTGEPPTDQLDLIERMVKAYDIRLCFHNHPKDPKRPEYRNWEPAYLLTLMDKRDPRQRSISRRWRSRRPVMSRGHARNRCDKSSNS